MRSFVGPTVSRPYSKLYAVNPSGSPRPFVDPKSLPVIAFVWKPPPVKATVLAARSNATAVLTVLLMNRLFLNSKRSPAPPANEPLAVSTTLLKKMLVDGSLTYRPWIVTVFSHVILLFATVMVPMLVMMLLAEPMVLLTSIIPPLPMVRLVLCQRVVPLIMRREAKFGALLVWNVYEPSMALVELFRLMVLLPRYVMLVMPPLSFAAE